MGYVVKGKKKVCFHTDDELQKLIDTTLSKGKGKLWCDCVMQGEENDDVNPAGALACSGHGTAVLRFCYRFTVIVYAIFSMHPSFTSLCFAAA